MASLPTLNTPLLSFATSIPGSSFIQLPSAQPTEALGTLGEDVLPTPRNPE